VTRFDFWRFMNSPSRATESQARAKNSRGGRRGGRPVKTERPRVPWWISVCFFVGVFRVVLEVLMLLAVSTGIGEPMPVWFNWLIVAHGVAMIVTLVFVLNGFGWARLAYLALALAQLALDQGIISKWFLLFDVVVLVVLILPPSVRYIVTSATARRDALTASG